MNKSLNKTNFALGILLAVIGVLVTVSPENSIKAVVILLGAGAFCNGLYNLSTVRNLSEDSTFRLVVVIRAWLSIAVGLLAICLPLLLASVVVTVFVYVLALYLILSAATEFYLVYKLHQIDVPSKNLLLEAVGSLVVAVVLFMLPAHFGLVIVRILGVLLIICGVVYAIYEWKDSSLIVEPDSIRDADESEKSSGKQE